VKRIAIGLGLLLLSAPVCSAGGEPGRGVLELSGGPVITECAPSGADAVVGVAAQYTWLKSPGRVSTLVLLARYRHAPFVTPSHFNPGPPEPGRVTSRGESEPRCADFAEFAVGARTSSPGGRWFSEFEGGLAGVWYSMDADDQVRREASPFVGLRFGTGWPHVSRVSATATGAVRVFPGVAHIAAELAVGVAWAPWGAGTALAPAPN